MSGTSLTGDDALAFGCEFASNDGRLTAVIDDATLAGVEMRVESRQRRQTGDDGDFRPGDWPHRPRQVSLDSAEATLTVCGELSLAQALSPVHSGRFRFIFGLGLVIAGRRTPC